MSSPLFIAASFPRVFSTVGSVTANAAIISFLHLRLFRRRTRSYFLRDAPPPPPFLPPPPLPRIQDAANPEGKGNGPALRVCTTCMEEYRRVVDDSTCKNTGRKNNNSILFFTLLEKMEFSKFVK